MLKENRMKSKAVTIIQAVIPASLLLIAVFGAVAAFAKAARQTGQGTAASPQPAQKVFRDTQGSYPMR